MSPSISALPGLPAPLDEAPTSRMPAGPLPPGPADERLATAPARWRMNPTGVCGSSWMPSGTRGGSIGVRTG